MIDHIADALDAETPITEEDIIVTSEQLEQLKKEADYQPDGIDIEDSLDGDREFVQDKLRDAINQATGMLPGLVSLAKVAESPNLYNSASKFLDSLASLGNTLIDIRIKTEKHKQSKESKSTLPNDNPIDPQVPLLDNQSNNQGVYEGTTEEFLDHLINIQSKKPLVIENKD